MSDVTPQGPTGPEYLEPTAGRPVSAGPSENRKRLLVLGGVLGVVALGGAAAWAVTSFVGSGAQPAEALPAATLAYASVDLDPSGSQKIEALEMLRKFPAINEELDLETDDDLRRKFFEDVMACEDVDFGADVEPWLGHAVAMAAVDTGGEQPVPVGVLEVTDAGGAEEGLARIAEACGGDDETAWHVEGSWALLTETQEQVDKVAELADDGTLADDDDFTGWTGQAGGEGIISMYAAPEAGPLFLDLVESTGMGAGASAMGEFDPETGEFEESTTPEELPDDVKAMFEEFKGAAATVRFSDGSLELEYAVDGGERSAAFVGDGSGVDLVESLPEGTLAALGVSLADGWFAEVANQLASTSGQSTEELYAELSASTGLAIPEDLETLAGNGLAVSVGEGLDLDAFFNGGAAELPVAVKVDGDPEAIEGVLDKLRPQLGPDASLLETETSGDAVVLGPRADYRSLVAEGGDLGGSDAYQAVVEDVDDPAGVFFVDFDADDNWLARLAGQEDPELAANLEPLSAFGLVASLEGTTQHGFLRLTTD